MQNPSIPEQRAKKNEKKERYGTSTRRLHSILRKLYKYVLRKQLYYWRGEIMTYANCPNKLRLLLADQIKSKEDLDSLLKKGDPITFIKYESKTHLNEEIKKICTYLSQNQQRSRQQTEKLVQIIYDFREPLAHIFRRQCYGSQSLDQVLVDYLNEEFSNLLDTNKFTVECNVQLDIEKLLEHYENEIILEEMQRNLIYLDTNSSQQILKIQDDEKDLQFQSENYNKEKFQVYIKEDLTEMQRNNYMIKYRNHIEEYLWFFEDVKTFQRKDTRYRFKPKTVTTQSLKKSRQVGHLNMSYHSEQKLMESHSRENLNEEQQNEKGKKNLKERSHPKSEKKYKVKQASKDLKQKMQKLKKSKNKVSEQYRQVQGLINKFPQIQQGLNIMISNRLQANQNKLLDLVTPDKMKRFDNQSIKERRILKVKRIYQLESLEGKLFSQYEKQLFRGENYDFFSAIKIDQNQHNQLTLDKQSMKFLMHKNEKTYQRWNFSLDDDQFFYEKAGDNI